MQTLVVDTCIFVKIVINSDKRYDVLSEQIGIRICISEKHNAHGTTDHDLYMFDPNIGNYTLFVVVDLCLLWLYYVC